MRKQNLAGTLAGVAIATWGNPYFSDMAIAQTGLVVTESPHSVADTVELLEDRLTNKGLNIFGKVDHAQGAASVNMDLPPTQVVIFGNPAAGTPLMQCSRTVAIDLPQKMLVWEEDDRTFVAFNDPAYLNGRHDLADCEEALAGIGHALQGIVMEITHP